LGKAKSNSEVAASLLLERDAVSPVGVVGLASPVAPSVLAPRRKTAAFSACKLDSDLPDCSTSPNEFDSDLLDDAYDAARRGGSMFVLLLEG
jgi:hypothetical protein